MVQAQSAQTETHRLFLPLVSSYQEFTSAPTDPSPTPTASPTLPIPVTPPVTTTEYAVVFVSRQIPSNGSVYWDVPNDMPGVMPYSRFRIAAPGKLLVREADGSIRVLIDGTNPTDASLHLIDVNAPAVSYDATQIVFSGLPTGTYDPAAMKNPNAWRLYIINVDGSGLRQLTFSDQDDLDLSQFAGSAGQNQLSQYDDTDPAWLPDGRIAFASTRWPSFAQYGAARTTNLYVINADGSNLQRITAERNGAERPLVDPLTGKIVYSRWWRNHRFAINDLTSITHPDHEYIQHNGLTSILNEALAGNKNLKRNDWHLASINPDGTDLKLWSGISGTFGNGQLNNQAYGGAFTPDGVLYANYFPAPGGGTESGGFGGIRRYERGVYRYTPILGLTTSVNQNLASQNPASHGVYAGAFAGEPDVLPDGRIIVSWAPNYNQDYGIHIINADGSNLGVLYDNAGTTELRARVISPRPVPPVIEDTVIENASLLPPLVEGPYDIDGTFTFDALNVYFNAPVDVDIVSAIPVGSAGSIRFFVDHQRLGEGSFPSQDWPILLGELPVAADGSVKDTNAPANVPLFEQIRTRSEDGYTVPLTGRGFAPDNPIFTGGAAHVAGLNFGRPGSTAKCVGCHVGHTLIPVPDNPEDALWTNLAPGATITVSSAHSQVKHDGLGLIDRRALTGSQYDYWRSDPNEAPDQQWIQLTFPVPVVVRAVRLYNPRFNDQANSDLQVAQATVTLLASSSTTGTLGSALLEVGSAVSGPLSEAGTDIAFDDVTANVVRIAFNDVTGTFYGQTVASLAEIEVIAKGIALE